MNTYKKTTAQKQATSLLTGDAGNVLLYGGSRSGKTFMFIYALFVRALKCQSRHAIFRYRYAHAKQALWYDTIPKVNSIAFPEVVLKTNKQDLFLTFPNGSEIWIGGLDDKERTEKVLGNEYSTIYYNEISQISYEAVLIAKTRLAQKTELKNREYYDCNPPTKSHWSYKLFIEKKDPKTGGVLNNPENYVSMIMHPESNRMNLASNYIENSLMNLPEKQRKRFLDGIFQDDLEGALWNYQMINKNRVDSMPDGLSIYKAIAIDPAVTSSEFSDETGIISGGKASNGHYYILSDKSGIYSPSTWGNLVAQEYRKGFNKVIGEANNGGDLIESNLKAVDPSISYQKVWASSGKIKRAEPVAALYEQGLVHHVGYFNQLESEMTEYTGSDGEKSPNRLDAIVWLINFLLMMEGTANIIPTYKLRPSRI